MSYSRYLENVLSKVDENWSLVQRFSILNKYTDGSRIDSILSHIGRVVGLVGGQEIFS